MTTPTDPFPIPLRGHRDAFERLRGTLARERLAHAYLFVGPAGIGKKRFAFAVAQCLLCDARDEHDLSACGRCPGCKQVLKRSHPDLFYVSRPEGKSSLPIRLLIGEDESRGKEGLLYDISRRPMAGGLRIAIIDDAEWMDDPAANVLLKTLEEPPPQSLLILLAPSAELLLPTIRSRCQVLRFSPLSETDVAVLLLEQGLTEDPREAAEAAALSLGSVETAQQLLDPKLREHRTLLYDGLAAQPFRAPQLAARLNAAIEEAGDERSTRVQHAQWLLTFGVEFFRQSLRRLSGVDEQAGGRISQIDPFIARWTSAAADGLDVLADMLERCITAQSQLAGNAVIPLCIEHLCDDLGRFLRTGGA